MAAIYGHLWSSTHSEAGSWAAAKDTWAQHLEFFGTDIIGKVLNDLILKEVEYPPTLVKFIKMCRAYSGFPSEQESYKQALNKDFSSALTKEVSEMIGHWAMTHDSEKELKAKWKEAYLTVVAKFYQKHSDQKKLSNAQPDKTEEKSFYRQPKGYEPTPTADRPDPKVEEWEAKQRARREAQNA